MERFVTVGVDGSVGGRRALDWAIRHALATGATVDIVTAFKPEPVPYNAAGWGDGMDLSREFAAERQDLDLRQVLAHFRDVQPPIKQRLVAGDPVDVLIDAAWTSDLLVLGSHGSGQLATVLGSVSEACIRRGVTPVLVVPAHDRTTMSHQAENSLPVPTSATA
jgi:nucleotide-binding universal stress UspA family protein